MEKKVYKIRRWFCNSQFPEEARVLPRRDYDDLCEARKQFSALANGFLNKGCRIVRVVHPWCYEFVTFRGSKFSLYMYED